MTRYPVVEFIVKHGSAIAIGIGLLPLLAAIAAVAAGCHWLYLPAGAVVAAIVYLLMKSYTELVAIIADMLLPK